MSAQARQWQARAHYTRWALGPAVVLHTLGECTMLAREEDWLVTELTVTRTWTTI
ncbi:hypothetical protein ACU635_15305 [[Actinomadura] parvosata]|uniref:hypothetical protein n=1 Tax=[Actinomadura] parvosata TaxID=1955412 RepID=UPI00406D1D41